LSVPHPHVDRVFSIVDNKYGGAGKAGGNPDLGSLLPSVLVMHGDGVVEDVLDEESLVCMTKEAMTDEGRE
jgi:hypothetical protein